MGEEDPGLQDLVNDFVIEAREHLATVEAHLLGLESGADSGPDAINRLFRAVHSVKGVAGFLGFENVNRLAHTMESVLDLVRKGRLLMAPPMVTELLGATDLLRSLIERVRESDTVPIDAQVATLQHFLATEQSAKSHAAGAATPAELPLDPGEALLELDLVVPRLELALGRPIGELPGVLAELGRVVAGASQLGAVCAGDHGPRDPLRVQLVTGRPAEAVRSALHLEVDEVRVLRTAPLAPAPSASGGEVRPAAAAVAQQPAPPGSGATDRAGAVEAGKPGPGPAAPVQGAEAHNESIRVSVHLLDKLMNLSGELVLGRNQLMQAQGTGNEKGVAIASARLNQVVGEVQEAVLQTRMQPVGNLFGRFPRVVRDLSGKLGKRCRLETEGGGVDLDRSILEALSDPLTHLVRNAVDHGLERPEERQAARKDPEGVVRLLAAQQGGNVRITITDDGRGIDPARLRRKAVEKELVTADQAAVMSDREAVLLIFAPGFSTAEQVTDVSGRGVGMDVVRSNIEKLGGHVDVHSTLGRGTVVAITIPLTLAILPAMVIRSGAGRYVLAQANVAELVRIRGAEAAERVVRMEGHEVLRLRGSVLPLLRLRQVLGEPAGASGAAATIVVVETGNLRYGLVVDGPPDAEEIVVKALGRHLKGRVEYSGATILGDGRVAMILDAAGIAEAARLAATENADAPPAAGPGHEAAEATAMVLFSNHPRETFAVPLGLVDRIQRVEAAALADVGGRLVYAEGDAVLPVVRLEQVVRAEPPETSPRVSVLVLRVGNQKLGVVAPQVEDVRSLTVRVDDRTLAEPGVLGSFRLRDRTVRMLDVGTVARRALPQLFSGNEGGPPRPVPAGAQAPVAAPARKPIRVLFAEDTKFFREHVTRTLRAAGFEVVAAADGELAWREIERAEAVFDVVVTDVQMPNCDGLELTRRIRRSERLRRVPVVALTSLSSSEDEARGMQAGVSAWLVKLDDAALVAAVAKHSGGGS
ncbi:MAG: response regulator [Planctomycetes bacterium]|nr:response regulator [Planctomycetota bacterium]